MQGTDDGGISTDRPFELGMNISRERRVRYGAMCKRLIDEGRLHYMQGCAGVMQAESVLYVDRAVSGENRLLVGRCRP